MLTLLLLFGAGLLAGAMNSLAGGGSFVTLPALIAVGVPSMEANASSTVALWPGGVAGAWTYFAGLQPVCRVGAWPMLAVTVWGSVLGSLLLLWTPSSAFDVVLPWLLLLATLALAFGRRVGAALDRFHAEWNRRGTDRASSGALSGRRTADTSPESVQKGRLRSLTPLVLAAQFALGVYGGYFGGAVGLMMVAAWSLFGASEVKSLNAPRTLLVSAANTVATLAFVVAGAVRWTQTLPMLAGGLLGGFAGARLGRRLPGNAVRALTLAATAAITCVFFVRAYL